MSTSVHASNKTKDILVLGQGRIYAEKMYSPNSSVENKILVLTLHYNSDNSFLFVNGQKVTQYKSEDSIVNDQGIRALTLGALTKPYFSGTNNHRLSPKNINDTKLYGNVYEYFK